jgi:uncharacterized membrane protein
MARACSSHPVVPWIAVAAGYAIGPRARSRAERRARFLGAGLAVTGGF